MYNLLKSFGKISWEKELIGDIVNLMELTEPRGEQRIREFEEKLAICDILQTDVFVEINEELLQKAPNLKAIFCTSSGVDYVDLKAASRRGVIVANNPDFCALSVAEFTIGLLYGMLRHIPEGVEKVKANNWFARGKMCGTEVYGKKLGVIGYGKIGKEVARQAMGVGMEVSVYTPSLQKNDSLQKITVVDMETLLKTSDVITIHVPLTEDTKNLIGKRELAMMKPQAYLINVSRGGIVDEEALCEALTLHRIAGAALDVLSREPMDPASGLLRYDGSNLMITPHIAWYTDEAIDRQCQFFAAQVRDFAAGRIPRAVVNQDSLNERFDK